MLCNRSSEAFWHLALVRADRDHRVVRATSMWMWRQRLMTSRVTHRKFANTKNDSIRKFCAQLCGVWTYSSVLKMDLCYLIDLVKARCVCHNEASNIRVWWWIHRCALPFCRCINWFRDDASSRWKCSKDKTFSSPYQERRIAFVSTICHGWNRKYFERTDYLMWVCRSPIRAKNVRRP